MENLMTSKLMKMLMIMMMLLLLCYYSSSCLGIYLNKWNLVNNLSELYEKFPLEIAAVYQCVYLIIALTVLLGWPTLPGGCQQETLSFRYLYLPLICRYIDNNNKRRNSKVN